MEIDLQASVLGMDIADLNGLLYVVSCRPGMKFVVHPPSFYCMANCDACLHYSMTVTNTYHPDLPPVELHMHKPATPSFVCTVEDFYDWCEAIALWFDDHEGREWFKVNGRPWRDPHENLGATNPFKDREQFNRVKAMRPPPPPPPETLWRFTYADDMF